MDTRTKIIDVARLWELSRAGQLRIVAGAFDVLLAAHVRRLRDLRRSGPLGVLLLHPPDPLLDARARAELVAALEIVDYVALASDAALPNGAVHHLEDDATARGDLITQVLKRHA